jgi:hypothetical protein
VIRYDPPRTLSDYRKLRLLKDKLKKEESFIMETKKWYASKTLWVNLLLLVGVIAQTQFGFEVTAEEQGAVIVIVNLILRAVTKQGLQV